MEYRLPEHVCDTLLVTDLSKRTDFFDAEIFKIILI